MFAVKNEHQVRDSVACAADSICPAIHNGILPIQGEFVCWNESRFDSMRKATPPTRTPPPRRAVAASDFSEPTEAFPLNGMDSKNETLTEAVTSGLMREKTGMVERTRLFLTEIL